MTSLIGIHRHPIKGFTAEALSTASLSQGCGLPFDRHFAFVSGNKEDQPVAGQWVQPRTFLMLTLYPELARFDCKLIDDDTTLRLTDPDGNVVEATRGAPDTFEDANAMLVKHFDHGPHGGIRLVEQAKGRGNWDFSDTEISIINLATVRVISDAIGRDLEKERFRGNLYIDGLEPWEEFSWPGCRIRIGDAELDVLRPIQRCAMTSTEPGTGLRETDVPKAMTNTFGHHFCGVYAKVHAAGRIATNDTIEIAATDCFNPYDVVPERAAAPALWPRFVQGSDESSDLVAYRTTATRWPLLETATGQTIRSHPVSADQKPERQELSHATSDGWFVKRPQKLASLVSGPYGRRKE